MNPIEFQARVTAMRETMRRIEQEAVTGAVPAEALEDFKRAVDEARMRIWASLTAANTDDPQAFLQRFRVRRAIDICRSVVKDLAEGGVRSDRAELAELQAIARQITVPPAGS